MYVYLGYEHALYFEVHGFFKNLGPPKEKINTCWILEFPFAVFSSGVCSELIKYEISLKDLYIIIIRNNIIDYF